MSDPFESTVATDTAPFVGKHYIYTYANDWQYEFYIRNERTLEDCARDDDTVIACGPDDLPKARSRSVRRYR